MDDPGRNDPCPCGSGKKYKHCHMNAAAEFERLREHSQHNGRKLSDVAAAVVESHLLLLPELPSGATVSPAPVQSPKPGISATR